MMKVGSLFTGIGGIDLGLERAGFEIAWQCELDSWCRQLLHQHWPSVPQYEDVTELRGGQLEPVEMLAGGFPCQDVSVAGRQAGLKEGTRSGLWSEYARLIGEIRPRYVLVENVPGLLVRGMDRVLGDLSEIGYDAEWHCIPASYIGAPHQRDRIWIMAYSSSTGLEGYTGDGEDCGEPGRFGTKAGGPVSKGSLLCGGLPKGRWPSEPDVGRVAHGIPNRVDRLKCLGNALVPQIPEMIGHAIIHQLEQTNA